MNYITSFRGEYFFLSNFYECPVTVPIGSERLTFSNSEAAFQAFKCPARAKEFVDLTGGQAKHLGKRVQLRNNWNDVRVGIMLAVCRAKFSQNSELMEKLVNTEEFLVEGNTWNDTFWGVCRGNGQNWLGRILVTIRDEERVKRGMKPLFSES